VNLAVFTADIASVFRSMIEKAGLRFAVDCAPVSEPVYVDRSMWEKVVLNLLSNAFKFTFKGEIAVSLSRVGRSAELSVRDTGTGIVSMNCRDCSSDFTGSRARPAELSRGRESGWHWFRRWSSFTVERCGSRAP